MSAGFTCRLHVFFVLSPALDVVFQVTLLYFPARLRLSRLSEAMHGEGRGLSVENGPAVAGWGCLSPTLPDLEPQPRCGGNGTRSFVEYQSGVGRLPDGGFCFGS